MNAPIRAPRGSTLSCKGWVQEAALRMLMNNLDPEVAEKPEVRPPETGSATTESSSPCASSPMRRRSWCNRASLSGCCTPIRMRRGF